jgi:flavin-dependent dehydrogenase
MTAWDVVVIGGGVAGSTAAAWLARGGLRVLLVDKGTYPRQKVCGEFLSPEGAELLQRLGAWSQIVPHRPQPIHTFALSAGRREVRLRLPAPGWGIRRWTLDRLLWEHAQSAGVTAWSRTAVRQVSGDFARGFTLTVQAPRRPAHHVQARAVICAAGRHWRQAAPHPPRSGPRAGQYLGVKAHVHGVALDGRVELHSLRQGYCGLAEVDGGMTTVCCWVGTKAFRQAGGTPERLLATALQQSPHLRKRLRRAQRLVVPWTAVAYIPRSAPAPLVGGVWKVGDSVATIAPCTGDGMSLGMQAAERAAALLGAVFRNDLTWAEATVEYERSWRQEFLPRLAWGRRVDMVLRRPWLAGLACGVVGAMPSLADAIYRRTRNLRVPITPHDSGTALGLVTTPLAMTQQTRPERRRSEAP